MFSSRDGTIFVGAAYDAALEPGRWLDLLRLIADQPGHLLPGCRWSAQGVVSGYKPGSGPKPRSHSPMRTTLWNLAR
jgi:hypothetical protein